MTGLAESAFSWLSVNYFTASDISNQPVDQDNTVLDLGGSSLQVAFRPDGPARSMSARYPIIPMSSSSQGVGVFAKSLDGFGDREMIIKAVNAKRCSEPARCVGQEFTFPCLHESYTSTFVHGTYRFTIKGSPEVTSRTRLDACKLSIERAMLNFTSPSLIIHRLHRLMQDVPLVGLSGIYYSARYINEVLYQTPAGDFCSGYRMRIKDFLFGADFLCRNPDRSTDRFKPYACAQATYMYMLLNHAPNSFRWIDSQIIYACKKFARRSNPTKKFKASWSLGVAVQSKLRILRQPITNFRR